MKIKVNMKQAGRRKDVVGESVFTIPGEPETLRGLLEALALLMAGQYNRRVGESELLGYLTRKELEDKAAAGKVGFSADCGGKKADEGAAVDNVIQCFEDGIYRVFLNNRELTSLDEPVQVTQDDSLTFVRLTMLAGRIW